MEGGQRDFLWPVPGCYNLTSCFLDRREHYSLDIDGDYGDEVVASYRGVVIDIFDSCTHNYGDKTEACCSSWGNFVLLEHAYRLKNGNTTTLYSRYAHLGQVSVTVGQAVSAGDTLGTVGSTGYSTGAHLDYEILYGGTSPSRLYSIDPYINDILELPEGLYTTFGDCCQEYVKYVKALYPTCAHTQYDSQGTCTNCGYVFDWKATANAASAGTYSVNVGVTAPDTPYEKDTGTRFSAGATVSVNGTVRNSHGQTWYAVATESGGTAYVPESTLTFQSYFDSQITGSLSTLRDGQMIHQGSYRLDGTVTSRYPLKTVTGYLDGTQYATWTAAENVNRVDLRWTVLNHNLSFSTLSYGDHTLTISATDSTGRESAQLLSCTFSVVPASSTPTVTYVMESGNMIVALVPGQPLGSMPAPEKVGYVFHGWLTESGEEVSERTVPEDSLVLYPQWEQVTYAVTFDNIHIAVPHGETIGPLPEITADGLTFTGWYFLNGEPATEDTIVTSDLIIYAKWTPVAYTVTLDPNGGTVSQSQFKVYFGETYGKFPTPVREGYRFHGWQYKSKVITQHVTVNDSKDHTLTAVWVKEPPILPVLLVLLTLSVIGGTTSILLLQKRKKRKKSRVSHL